MKVLTLHLLCGREPNLLPDSHKHHWILCHSLGLAVVMGILKHFILKTDVGSGNGQPKFGRRFSVSTLPWGVLTGLILEFGFKTNWNVFWFCGDIFGAPRTHQRGILAFFMEPFIVNHVFGGGMGGDQQVST